jgi:tungstate transport system substrate-binding protein
MKKTTTLFIYLLLILTFVLSGCTSATSEPLQPEPAPQEPAPAVEEPAPAEPASQNVLLLATTTSTQDSGLLDVILPDFRRNSMWKWT